MEDHLEVCLPIRRLVSSLPGMLSTMKITLPSYQQTKSRYAILSKMLKSCYYSSYIKIVLYNATFLNFAFRGTPKIFVIILLTDDIIS